MKFGRRGFLEIVAEVLTQLEKNPSRKTMLSYACKLDSRAMTKYLEIMEGIVMITKSNQNYYTITKKGNLYLKKYNFLIEPLFKS